MKKNLLVISALAIMGLFASCQKENVATPEQNAVEQNFVTVDLTPSNGKAELEAYEALAQSLADGKSDKWSSAEKKIVRILVDFLREVGHLVGANNQSPVHTFQSYGDWENFGLAFDNLERFSYNFNDAVDLPIGFDIQFGNASELKVSGLQVMPVKNFALGFNTNLYTKAAAIRARIVATNALIVKFTYKKQDYAFVVYSELSAGNTKGTALANGLHFGFISGTYHGAPSLVEAYQEAKGGSTIIPVYEIKLPINFTTALQCNVNLDCETYSILWGGYSFYSVADTKGTRIEFEGGLTSKKVNFGGRLSSNDNDAVKGLVRDYLKASVFGCSESESNSLVEQFFKVFPGGKETNLMKVNLAGPQADTYLSIKPEATSGMVWKPAFGVDLYGEMPGDIYTVSFSEIDEMNDEAFKIFQEEYDKFAVRLY